MHVFALESGVSAVLWWAMLAVGAWALVDAAVRRSDAFIAADKLTKPAWLSILALALVLSVVFGLGFLSIIGLVATLVYLADVRPALAELTRRR